MTTTSKTRRGRWIITIFIIVMVGFSFSVSFWATKNPKMKSLAAGDLVPMIKCTEILGPTTIEVSFSNRTEVVELLGVEAPLGAEGKALDDQAFKWQVTRDSVLQEHRTVQRILMAWLRMRRVTLIPPVDQALRNAEGHVIAYVEILGMDVGKKLLHEGHVAKSSEVHDYQAIYEVAEELAREQGLGLWR